MNDTPDDRSPARDLAARIAEEERRIDELTAEMEMRRALVLALRQERDSARDPVKVQQAPDNCESSGASPLSKDEKVRLFRSLFLGREDVFPRFWESQKTGRSGYSPACSNEWDPVLCGKKGGGIGGRSGCAACPNRVFLPVTDEQIVKHLQGTQVMGVFPLLPDETCRFLAADFDGKSWKEDVAAFRHTSGVHGVPVAVERSRSGNGAHAWIVFTAPVSASIARNLGCFLITESMSRRHMLSMSSYDRLFPNQDTMPKGGFGNLIALPLQRKARADGNTVFLDDSLQPYPGQWAFLSGLERMEPDRVREIVKDADRKGQIMGIRSVDTEGESDREPWKRPPSGQRELTAIVGPLPPKVHAVLAQRLFIEKKDLPSAFLNRLKRLAAFQNPEFYKKQHLRLSTAITPRVIVCAEDQDVHVALPRGCLPDVEALLADHRISLVLDDLREEGTPLDCTFRGTLTRPQEQAAKAMLVYDTGVYVAPPGSGKTVVGAFLIAMRKRNTLVIVHRKPLLDQWLAQLALFLGVDPKEIGVIGAGKNKPTGKVDVAMMQSLVRPGRVADFVADYGHVLVDECHHVPAVSFERVLSEVKARFVTGLTATPRRRDGQHPILYMQLGPVRFSAESRKKGEKRPFLCTLIPRETGFLPTVSPDLMGIQELYAMLAADNGRNDLICADVIRELEENRSPIVLTERRDHLECLAGRLRDHARRLIVLHGGMKAKERDQAVAGLAAVSNGDKRVVLATGRYVGEGFDDARLDTLFLALPFSWRGTLVQYAGRLHRICAGKTELRIYDYVDRGVAMLLRMFEKRLHGYRTMGYERREESNGKSG